jgi:hypothetical protein
MRWLIGFFVIMLLVGPMVLGDVASGEKNLTDVVKIGENLGALGGGLNEKTENVLDREIEISILKFFKFPEGKITITQLIILIIFLTITIGIITTSLSIVPFFNKKIFFIDLKLIIAISITLIASIVGTTYDFFILSYGIISGITIMAKLGIFQAFIWIIVGIIIIKAISSFSKNINQGEKLSKAEEVGKRIKKLDEINKIKIKAES